MSYRMGKVLAIIAILAAGSVAQASLMLDPLALPGFKGAEVMTSDTLSGTVEYAVYAPGMYPSIDPSADTEFLYAYQVFTTGEKPITVFSVGADAASGAHLAVVDPAYGVPGGLPATFWGTTSTSVLASFLAPELVSGAHSMVLLYTSPLPPTYVPSFVGDGGKSAGGLVPAPIPEPSVTMMAAVLGGLGLLRRGRRQA